MSVDLNADLGEGVTDDEGLLAVVTSANVACGFHAGDPLTMLRVCRSAAALGVDVGAQVSYRDRTNFGRVPLEPSDDELYADVLAQIASLSAIARSAGTTVTYVKPHGALYSRVVTDVRQAKAVVSAVRAYDRSLALLCLPGSALHEAGEGAGLVTRTEAFADRAYLPDGTLVPRTTADAVHHERAVVVAQAVSIARDRSVTAVDGRLITVHAQSICLHGDTPGAVVLARAVRDALRAAGVAVRAVSGSPPHDR